MYSVPAVYDTTCAHKRIRTNAVLMCTSIWYFIIACHLCPPPLSSVYSSPLTITVPDRHCRAVSALTYDNINIYIITYRWCCYYYYYVSRVIFAVPTCITVLIWWVAVYNKYVPTVVTVTFAAARLPRKHDGYNMYATTELLLLLYASSSDDDDDICVVLATPRILLMCNTIVFEIIYFF